MGAEADRDDVSTAVYGHLMATLYEACPEFLSKGLEPSVCRGDTP